MAMKQVELMKKSDHKRVVKYENPDPNAVIGSVYLNRNFSSEMPSKIFVAVSDDPILDGKEGKEGKKAKG